MAHFNQNPGAAALKAKHGRIPIFDPRFGTRTNTKQVFVFAFPNKYLKFQYSFAFV